LALLWCSIGSDEDDDGDGDEEASVGDPSETAVSRDAAKELTSSSSSSSSSATSPLDHCPDIPDTCLTEVAHICCTAIKIKCTCDLSCCFPNTIATTHWLKIVYFTHCLVAALSNVKVRRWYCSYNTCVGQMVLFEDVVDRFVNCVGL